MVNFPNRKSVEKLVRPAAKLPTCSSGFSARPLVEDSPSGIAPAQTAVRCVQARSRERRGRRPRLQSARMEGRGFCWEHRPICAPKSRRRRNSSRVVKTGAFVNPQSLESFSPTPMSTILWVCFSCANCSRFEFTRLLQSVASLPKTTRCSRCSSARLNR